MPRPRNKKSNLKDDEVTNGKRISKIKQVQEQQNDTESGSSESASSKKAPQDDSSNSDVNDDDEFSSSTVTEILKKTRFSGDDEKAYESFMVKGVYKTPTLADFVKEEIKDPFKCLTDSENESDELQMYKGLAKHLAKYSGGEFPTEFEAINKIRRWEQILNFMEPEMWSAFSLRQACGIFSKFSDMKAQRFYNLVLLPRLRKDLNESKTLTNSHLSAIREALRRKPAAFFKGVVIPLCETGDCTLQEAIVFSSVLVNFEVHHLYSVAALLTIAEMKYNSACSIFMKALLEKEHELSYRVINAIITHFLGFMKEKRKCPVVWHECLLTFLENYKSNLTADHKKNLLQLVNMNQNIEITPKIQKKLGFTKRTRYI